MEGTITQGNKKNYSIMTIRCYLLTTVSELDRRVMINVVMGCFLDMSLCISRFDYRMELLLSSSAELSPTIIL